MPRSRSSPNVSDATAHDGPMLATRLISAGILAPIVVAVALLGEPWVSSLVGLLVFLAMVELIALLDAGGFATTCGCCVAWFATDPVAHLIPLLN